MLNIIALLGTVGFTLVTGGAIALTILQVTSQPDGRGLNGPPSAVGANTNPALNAAPAYQSIIEDETRQFIKQPKGQ